MKFKQTVGERAFFKKLYTTVPILQKRRVGTGENRRRQVLFPTLTKCRESFVVAMNEQTWDWDNM
jgi:hypothetical protein